MIRKQLLGSTLGLLAGALLCIPAFAADNSQQAPSADSYVLAQAVADAPNEGPERHHHPMLSDDQLERLASLKDQYRIDTAAKKAQLHSLHRQMMSGLTAASIDRGSLGSINDKINALHSDLSRIHLKYMEDRAEVFTPEQRAHFHHMMLMHAMMGHHHHHHGGGCGGGHHHGWGGKGGHHEHGKAGHGGERAEADSAPQGPGMAPETETDG